MKANARSVSGALLMLMIIPAIVGVLACLPVPIGDPERSRIDPEISGVWAYLEDGGPVFYAFEPYDKRTWLVTGVPVEEGEDADFSDYELDNYDELARLIEDKTLGDDGITATEVALYKAWLTKLGGEWFMTWEPRGVFDNEKFIPDVWLVFRIERPDEATLDLYMVGDTLFKDVPKTRRAYERIIKKNARNDELTLEDPMRFYRLRPEHFEFFSDLAEEVFANDN